MENFKINYHQAIFKHIEISTKTEDKKIEMKLFIFCCAQQKNIFASSLFSFYISCHNPLIFIICFRGIKNKEFCIHIYALIKLLELV